MYNCVCVRCQTYLCFLEYVSEHYAPVSVCICVSSRAHCEGVIAEPRPCKLSDSERCCTSKGHAFWAFPVYYKPCNTHQGCCSAPPCPSSIHGEKPPFLTRRALASTLVFHFDMINASSSNEASGCQGIHFVFAQI